MKRNIFCVIAAALGLTSCIVSTPVVTKQPTTVVVKQPATVVVKQPATTVVTTKTVTTPAKTVYVNATSDLSYDLDLQAVAIAFAEARTLEEFEWFLNDYTRQISNLDLNRDGYVDYLRVVEQIYNGTHLIIVQDVYALNACQDVATIVVENSYYTQIVGNPYIYGANYIIEPVFVSRPAVYSQWGTNYKVWTSPYHWNHYPPRHQHRAPKPQQTYYSHIDIYITNHYYCSDFGYAETYHYNNYPTVYQSYHRNDYGRQYPDQSFASRLTTTYNGTRATNARQLTGTRDISSTRTISTRTKTATSTSGTRASSTGSTQNNSTQSSSASRTATRTSTSTNTSATTTGTKANAAANGKVTTTSRTANSTTTTTSRKSGNTTRSNSTTRMVDGDKQVTTQTRVQASPTQTKITTTTTTTDPTSTSTRKVTTTTKTNRTTGQTSTRSKVSERSSAISNRAETNQGTTNPTTTNRAAKTPTATPAATSTKSTTRSRANENTGVRDAKSSSDNTSRTRR